MRLTLDGAEVAADRMRFCVNDRDYTLDELGELFDDFWFVLDPARLRVSGVEPGEHDVEVQLSLRIPYLFDEETGDILVVRPGTRLTVTVPDQAHA